MSIVQTLLTHYLRWFNARHLQLRPREGYHPRPHAGKPYLLYLHIPFCESLCPYCSFHRVKFEQTRALDYFQGLQQELRYYHAAGFQFSEIYVGGGTPTVLPEQLLAILQLAQRLFPITSISLETNPNHLRQPILDLLREAGVKRLSVGVQSMEDSLLQEMERFGPYGGAQQILDRLACTQGQFETFNVDMMFNFPHQTPQSLQRDIARLKALRIDQVSYYPLMPAILTRQRISQRIGEVDFKRERQLYRIIIESLAPEYRPTSAWCFSRCCDDAILDEYIAERDEYVGIGSGAFSYLDGAVYASSFSIRQYLELVAQGLPGLVAARRLTLREQAQYDFLMRLFGGAMSKHRMREKYGTAYHRLIRKELWLFKRLGALQETDEAFRLTRQGLYYWVLMMREFFMAVNNFRMQMRNLAKRHDEIPGTIPLQRLPSLRLR